MNNNVILKQWTRLGAGFNVKPASRTPDIERLLLDTAAALPETPRLLPVCVTWLIRYYRLVCKHRLAGFASDVQQADTSATLGLMLNIVKEITQTDHFNLAIKVCRSTKDTKPLFIVDRRSKAMAQLSKHNSSPVSRKWGLWCEPVQIKEDSIRPLTWVMRHNPTLKQRALFSGNLRASILETLTADRQAGQSESALAHCCHATRKAVREALDHLEFCQLVTRSAAGRKVCISLT